MMRVVAVSVCLVMGTALSIVAQGPPASAVNVDGQGVALHGHDAVAYFTVGKAVPGTAQYEHQWNGARWRFSSAANRDLFAKMPETYAPQFGGYCAWAVSRNYTADIDPASFAVVNGKLYVNYSTVVQVRWRLDRDGNIARAEANWPGLLSRLPAAAPARKAGGR